MDLHITREELFAFHNIDRQLFSRLVFTLGHEPWEAMHAAAFWLWLEHFNNNMARCCYVDTILTLPHHRLENVIDETLLCLRAAQLQPWTSNINPSHSDIPTIQTLTGLDGIHSSFFQNNRILVLFGVRNIVQNVCLRVFQDFFASPPFNTHPHISSFDVPNSETRSQAPQEDLVEMFDRIDIDNIDPDHQEVVEDKVTVVPTAERTIFLTFSKGYPISETELREFLARSFGEIVEALHMQEVGEKEQPLYARLVVPDLSTMETLLSGKTKVKFSINGKHVWARKYVRKNNSNSPPSSPN